MEVDDQTQKRCTEAGEGNETKKQQREDDVLKNRNAVVDFDPSPVHSMQIKPMSIGEVNRVPLAMCKTGSRVWSRRRDPPFSLEYADITPEGELQAWTPVVTDEEGAEVYELGECKVFWRATWEMARRLTLSSTTRRYDPVRRQHGLHRSTGESFCLTRR